MPTPDRKKSKHKKKEKDSTHRSPSKHKSKKKVNLMSFRKLHALPVEIGKRRRITRNKHNHP
jgi:hypothetical protein